MASKFVPYLHERSFDLSDTSVESSTDQFHRLACGLGNTLNDLCIQLFTSFRLVFFMNVLGLSAENSGWLVLQKELMDTVMAPVCAMLVNRVHIPLVSRKYGKIKTWHLLGTVLHTVFVPLSFAAHYLIRSEDGKTERMMMIYFGILNVISSFGDSILDISHLCLISAIAKDQMEAVELSAIRSVFSYLSDILTFAVAWVILGQDSKSQISEDSSKDFMVLTAILVAVGVLTSLLYHLGTKEPSSCPPMALRKLSTLAAGNSARLTAFIPSRVLGKQMPSFATGLDVVRKLSSRPSPKVSLVSFCDAIRRTAAKCDENEGKMLPKETDSPKENQHCISSSLSNDPTAIGVVNKGLNLSVLDLYSDGDTNHVGNEAAPTHASAVSMENKRAPLSETEANSEPVIHSGSNIDRKKSCPSKKTFRVTISDEIQLTPKKFNTRKGQTLLKKKKPPEGDLQSFSSDPYCASVVDKPRSASVLDVYSDEESNVTSQVSKEPKPIINVSDISLETKSTHLSNTEAKGSNTSEQESHPSRKKARVSFSDGIRCTTTTKSNANEEETLILNENESPKRDHKSWSSDGPNCTDGVNKDLPVSVLGLRSDDKSNDTRHGCEEPAPVNASAISLEIKNSPLSKTKANSKPIVNSCESVTPPPRRLNREKTVRDWLFDPCLHIVSLTYTCQWVLEMLAFSYLPLLLIYRLRLSQGSIAYLPLIMSISASVSSILSKKVVQKIGNKVMVNTKYALNKTELFLSYGFEDNLSVSAPSTGVAYMEKSRY